MSFNFFFGTSVSQSVSIPYFFPTVRSAGEVDIVGGVLLFKTVVDKTLISPVSRGDD